MPPEVTRMSVSTGLDVLAAEGFKRLRGRRVGLITNPTGVDRLLRANVDLMVAAGGVGLVALFGPEHGIRGEAPAGQRVGSSTDPVTRLPVYSLYGEHDKPAPETLGGLDALVFDIQGAGVRFYTYASTMLKAMEAAAQTGVRFVVLDRPNPINGQAVEGGPVEPGFESLVGWRSVPIRHGLTLGELAWYVNEVFGVGADLDVVAMTGWRRGMWYDQTGLSFVPPSPNTTGLDMLALYPGTCFLEGTNVSEGRGTTKPFEVFGAPWADGRRLAAHLNGRGLDGVRFRPVHFRPLTSKHEGHECGGVQAHVTDRSALRPVRLGLEIVAALRALHPDRFVWVGGREGRSYFDLLTGTAQVRSAIEAGQAPADIERSWAGWLADYLARRQPYLLYKE